MSKGPKKAAVPNTPFAQALARLKAEAKAQEADDNRRAAEARQAAEAKRAAEAARQAEAGDADDDAALFLSAVGEVAPVHPAKAERRPPAPETRRDARIVEDEDAEVLAVLSDFVAGDGTLDVADTDEYIEGLAPGVDRRILGRLRRGEFSVQAHLDLHGMLQDPARHAVRRFLVDARARGLRCVLVIHGRGKNSRDKEPVLKKALVRWLSRGGLGKQILAFCTARPTDGGAGAVYVLLRR